MAEENDLLPDFPNKEVNDLLPNMPNQASLGQRALNDLVTIRDQATAAGYCSSIFSRHDSG